MFWFANGSKMVGSYDLTAYQAFMAASFGPATAAVFTNPIEVVKVRHQLAGQNTRHYKQLGVGTTLRALYRTEGLAGFQAGLPVSVLREATKNLFRIGGYAPILGFLSQQLSTVEGDGTRPSPPVWMRMMAGACSGTLSAYICNPIDLIKTRLQSVGQGKVIELEGRKANYHYSNGVDALRSIVREKGVAGLWAGAHSSALRSAAATAANLPSYTLLKEYLRSRGFEDNTGTHMICGLFAGFMTCVANNPADVVRSRLYDQPQVDGKPVSALRTAQTILRTEGILAFYKGFWPHYMRNGPHYVAAFTFIEMYRRWFSTLNS
eukprot:m.189601 g.189601  ORF g.189601 m.189601 type:complete len:321 (-) comp14798_c0_seq2:2560-3522(-)